MLSIKRIMIIGGRAGEQSMNKEHDSCNSFENRLATITINFNSSDDTIDLLESIFAYEAPNLKNIICVVDNSHESSSKEALHFE